jgi:hypothetical protein
MRHQFPLLMPIACLQKAKRHAKAPREWIQPERMACFYFVRQAPKNATWENVAFTAFVQVASFYDSLLSERLPGWPHYAKVSRPREGDL